MPTNQTFANSSYSLSEVPDYVSIGKFSSIGTAVTFHPLEREHLCSLNKQCVYTYNWEQPRGGGTIAIGSDVWIGDGVRLLNDVHIGNGVIIGAGAVIGSDVPDYTVAIGNPWRVMRKRFSDEQIHKLQQMKWWDWDYDVIINRRKDMENIELFLDKYYD